MSDQVIYEVASTTEGVERPFIKKEVVYVIDSNNKQYTSGQVILDTSSISNSNKWWSVSTSYLEIPIVLQLQPDADVANFDAANLQFAVGLKNGYWNLISSMSLELNGTSVIQLTPYQNFYTSYKMITTLSEADVRKFGAGMGFFPDTSSSWSYNAAASSEGLGISNNKNFGHNGLVTPTSTVEIVGADATAVTNVLQLKTALPAATGVVTTNSNLTSGYSGKSANEGFYERQLHTCTDVTNTSLAVFYTQARYQTLLENYYVSTGGVAAGALANQGCKTWYITARIYLKHLHDLFNQLPLSKSLYMRMIINFNQAVCKITGSAAQPSLLTSTAGNTTLLSGSTVPFMVASTGVGQGAYNLPVAGGDYYVGCFIQNVSSSLFTYAPSHPLTSVRLYCDLYTMSAEHLKQYLTVNESKRIVYKDIFQYTYSGVTSGTQFNFLASNGLVGLRTIVVIPMLSATGNQGYVSAHQSPFASEPANPSPLAISEFNVQISGVNVFMQNKTYSFTQFCDELSKINALNGGVMNQLTSGLISEFDYKMLYRYYIADVSRIVGDDKVPRSVQILGKNETEKTVDYYVFAEIEKEFVLNVNSGEITPV